MVQTYFRFFFSNGIILKYEFSIMYNRFFLGTCLARFLHHFYTLEGAIPASTKIFQNYHISKDVQSTKLLYVSLKRVLLFLSVSEFNLDAWLVKLVQKV